MIVFILANKSGRASRKNRSFNFNSTSPATSVRWPNFYHQIVCPLPALQSCIMGITASFQDITRVILIDLYPFTQLTEKMPQFTRFQTVQIWQECKFILCSTGWSHIGINDIMILPCLFIPSKPTLTHSGCHHTYNWRAGQLGKPSYSLLS